MKKKKIIAWSIAVGIVLTLCVVCAMVFTLSNVDFQLTALLSKPERSRLFSQGYTTSLVEDSMQESAKFDYGKNILFMNFDEQIENIEKANPFVKVEKIVRKFPNKAIVYYSEREAVALVPIQNVTNGYFVVDTELKILDYVAYNIDSKKYASTGGNEYDLPVVDCFGFAADMNQRVGEVVQNEQLKNYVSSFVGGAFSAYGEKTALYEDVMKFAVSIKFYDEPNDSRCQYVLKTELGADVTVTIYQTNDRLFQKVSNSWNLFIKKYRSSETEINLFVYISEGSNEITTVEST